MTTEKPHKPEAGIGKNGVGTLRKKPKRTHQRSSSNSWALLSLQSETAQLVLTGM